MRWAVVLLLFASAQAQQECATCHAAIARSYRTTPMANTSGPAASNNSPIQQASFTSPGGGAHYSVGKDPHGFFFDFRQEAIEGRRTLDYFVGSGLIGRSFLTSIDGFLFQAPVAYYSVPAKWGLSPGYERSEEINLLREAEPSCLSCHGVKDGGVTCIRCHGPGHEHVARMRSGKHSAGSGIVNPSKLEPARRDSVCAQCHLPGAVSIARTNSPYTPGARLSDSLAIFVWNGMETTVNGHFEQLARSACYRASQGKLWCGTCHQAHGQTASFKTACLRCHAGLEHVKANLKADCLGCHMPRRPAVTVEHAALTDHSIPRKPRDQALRPGSELALFGGEPAGDRELGLAYATLALQDANRTWGLRAFELLKSVPEDAKVDAQLGQLYDRMGQSRNACNLYARAVAIDPNATAAALNLGTCRAAEGKLAESIALWTGVLARNPGLESARLNLAVAQVRNGDPAAARVTLREALRFNPASSKALDLQRELK